MRLQFERPDGTFGAIEGGTVESMRTAATKIKAAGGRVTWVSDPAILVGQDTFVANAGRRRDVRDYDELPIMPVMNFGPNPMEQREPVTVLDVEAFTNNASQGELLPIMPVMNFGPNQIEHTSPMQAFAAQDIAPARPRATYVGAQGGGAVQRAANDDALLPIMPAMNFALPAPKTNGKRGRRNVRDDAGRGSEAESMVMPTMQF